MPLFQYMSLIPLHRKGEKIIKMLSQRKKSILGNVKFYDISRYILQEDIIASTYILVNSCNVNAHALQDITGYTYIWILVKSCCSIKVES